MATNELWTDSDRPWLSSGGYGRTIGETVLGVIVGITGVDAWSQEALSAPETHTK